MSCLNVLTICCVLLKIKFHASNDIKQVTILETRKFMNSLGLILVIEMQKYVVLYFSKAFSAQQLLAIY